jgi:integrase/recombinase XerD
MPRKGIPRKGWRPGAIKPAGRSRKPTDDPLENLALTAFMAAHFEWMLVTGHSPDTVRARRAAIRIFITWAAERGLSQPSEITKPVLERYQRHLFYYRKPDGKPLTIGTQHSMLAPLKTWFSWMARENHLLFNPASELQLPKRPEHLPQAILSVQEVEAVLAEAEPVTPQAIRDRALLETLYSTGIRRAEAANLKLYDVDPARGVVMVREGKGGKDRIVPIGERALAWLDRYLIEARPQLAAGGHDGMFVTDYGEPANPAFVASRAKLYMKYAGIKKPGSTHMFRHAMATHMLEGGADVRILQALLGHANLNTTEIYTHVSIEHLRAIHAATHPAKLIRPDAEPRPGAPPAEPG